MPRSFFLFFLLFCRLLDAFAQPVDHEGPYIFYQKDSLVQYDLAAKDSSYTVDRKAVSLVNTGNEFTVLVKPFESCPNGFDLPLRKIIIQPCQYPKPSKLFLVSDIEGEFAAFQNLLISNHVMDSSYGWAFGTGHLVICGDLFDRGKQVVQYLWLLYKLEGEAESSGGYVHVILGNHDIMNLDGDFRYVDQQYFTAAGFMNKEYKELYADNTELGRWLRSKNIIEKIGDILCLHAGIAPEITRLGLSVQSINNICRPYYAIDPDKLPDSVNIFFNEKSPFWYRGYFLNPLATEEQVDSSLRFFNGKQIIVGHTILRDISKVYNGKVIGIDVNEHEGNSQALLIEGDLYYRVNDKGARVLMN